MKKIFFTRHAGEKFLKESRLKLEDGRDLVRNAEPYPMPKYLHSKKNTKYGEKQKNVYYKKNGWYLFTLTNIINKFNKSETITLVITYNKVNDNSNTKTKSSTSTKTLQGEA